ncbi:zinc finger protein 891-like [Contarinia nasturtii]|uniref:zinc finger protein 891-like n=1 Tax=Contarinia nasturtii TaxID=265458 RepID=UPI0012D39410|nr:zinc finger protein 891-like [Contarinia nasturtii]
MFSIIIFKEKFHNFIGLKKTHWQFQVDFLIMESQLNHNICIKVEKCDGMEDPFSNLSIPAAASMVKEEKCDFGDNVIYQSVPWEQNKEQNIVNFVKQNHTLFEYDENTIINTEIKIEEPVIEGNSHKVSSRQKQKQKQKKTTSIQKKKTEKVSNAPKPKPKPTAKRKNKTPVRPEIEYVQCVYCSKRLNSQFALIAHFHRRHSEELQFQCRICTLRFHTAKQKHKHESNCKIRRYECYVCGFSFVECCAKYFSILRVLKSHLKKNHPYKTSTHCFFCERKFKTIFKAREHERNCSRQNNVECYLCKVTFKYTWSLRRHMQQHTRMI